MATEEAEGIVAATTKRGTRRFRLYSAPGGWVELRRLTHGEAIERLDLIVVKGDDGKERLSNYRARLYDFAHCIVNHNLGDAESGRKLDFTKAKDVLELDEEVGNEIQVYINTYHGRVAGAQEEGDDPN